MKNKGAITNAFSLLQDGNIEYAKKVLSAIESTDFFDDEDDYAVSVKACIHSYSLPIRRKIKITITPRSIYPDGIIHGDKSAGINDIAMHSHAVFIIDENGIRSIIAGDGEQAKNEMKPIVKKWLKADFGKVKNWS